MVIWLYCIMDLVHIIWVQIVVGESKWKMWRGTKSWLNTRWKNAGDGFAQSKTDAHCKWIRRKRWSWPTAISSKYDGIGKLEIVWKRFFNLLLHEKVHITKSIVFTWHYDVSDMGWRIGGNGSSLGRTVHNKLHGEFMPWLWKVQKK